MKNLIPMIVRSWANEEGNVHSTEDLLRWITELNETTYVNISECSIDDDSFWFYDDRNGEVLNRKRSFFSILGLRRIENGKCTDEHPVIVQPEIGYLGIICREIDGVLNFLMQAKIEPGNVNCVQISPTIQATKSNFIRAHGGKLPTYFEMFEHSDRYDIIYDQVQSEQGSRFYKKRNRNLIMVVDEDFEIYPNFRWMTLGQIKKLMEVDNLVNMDTRTVLSGIPFMTQSLSEDEKAEIEPLFSDKALFNSIFHADPQESLPGLTHKLNDYKMFADISTSMVPLYGLRDWEVTPAGITSRENADFMVRFYDIEIAGREVRKWTQPLFKAVGMATFGLITRVHDGVRQYLVRVKPEIGSFDSAELGPSIQWEPSKSADSDNAVDRLFRSKLGAIDDPAADAEETLTPLADVILSEEGGRFYHEQNRNIIIEIGEDELTDLPDDYIWTEFSALNYLIQANNCLNIQLRNLLSLIKL